MRIAHFFKTESFLCQEFHFTKLSVVLYHFHVKTPKIIRNKYNKIPQNLRFLMLVSPGSFLTDAQ